MEKTHLPICGGNEGVSFSDVIWWQESILQRDALWVRAVSCTDRHLRKNLSTDRGSQTVSKEALSVERKLTNYQEMFCTWDVNTLKKNRGTWLEHSGKVRRDMLKEFVGRHLLAGVGGDREWCNLVNRLIED